MGSGEDPCISQSTTTKGCLLLLLLRDVFEFWVHIVLLLDLRVLWDWKARTCTQKLFYVYVITCNE